MFKIVASDLDGTLLTSAHKIEPFTKKVLNQLYHQGVDFVFATGRHHLDVARMRDELGIPAFMITSNGARVHNCSNEIIFKQDVKSGVISDIIRMLRNDDEIHIHIFRDQDWLVSKEQVTSACVQDNFTYQLFDLSNPPVQDICKVFITRDDKDHDKLTLLEDKIKAKYFHQVNVSFSTPWCLEIMDVGVSKGHALDAVAKFKGKQLKDCIAFGDGMNDFEMLSMAGKGIVMGSAHHKVKLALPDNQVIGHCNDQAVANYLNKHLLIS